MNTTSLNTNKIDSSWNRFCDLLWHSDELGIWLDISKMKISNTDIKELEPNFKLAFKAIENLESGSIANIDESRQVGHYWLRNEKLAPSELIKNNLKKEKEKISEFSRKILNGSIHNEDNQPFKNVLWIGIGGSSLGPILLINSLKKNNIGLNFFFMDNVDPTGINDTIDLIKNELKRTLVVVVSKSGGTLEPRICMEQVRLKLENSGLKWNKQAIAITMKGSKLDNQAKNENWLERFDLPDWVGGRTSITSSVGLLPAALMGCDIDRFLEGASLMDTSTRNKELRDNPAALLAASWYVSGNAKGLKDMVILPYKDRLEVFSKYLQQLVMESLGKKNDRKGGIVNQGLSVYGNKGSTDQHAYIQQLRDGLDNFFAVFIEIIKDNHNLNINELMNPADYLSGFLQGTRKALTGANKESITISLVDLNEFSLGSLIALFERTVGLYAELINVNAYDQPGVEAGKIAAAEVIKKQDLIMNILTGDSEYDIANISEKLSKNSEEEIYWIIRSLSINNLIDIVEGNWSKPKSLKFKLK